MVLTLLIMCIGLSFLCMSKLYVILSDTGDITNFECELYTFIRPNQEQLRKMQLRPSGGLHQNVQV
jgi:hypothetical protein